MRSLLSGSHDEFLEGLERGLQRLLDCGCQELIICCFAAHHLVPLLLPSVRSRLVSLLDATHDELRDSPRSLVLCSSSTRTLALLERHPGWAAVAPRAVFPSDADQGREAPFVGILAADTAEQLESTMRDMFREVRVVPRPHDAAAAPPPARSTTGNSGPAATPPIC